MTAERLIGIDILRGIAVLVVVMNHVPHYAIGGFRENPWFFPSLLMDYGYLGVPLFVVISGFCIHRRAAIRQMKGGGWSLDWVAFWKRRFWRLYPPYVAAIVLSLFCALTLHDKSPGLLTTLGPDLATHLAMVHNLTADYSGGLGNGAFWSLGMEEQLYLLYFILFVTISRKSHRVALVLAACTSIAWRFAISDPRVADASALGGLGSWGVWPFGFWLHWALGALAVDAYFGNLRLPDWCSSLWVGLGFACLGMATNRLTYGFLLNTNLSIIDLEAFGGYAPYVSNVGELAFAGAFFCMLNWCVSNGSSKLLRNPLAAGVSYLGKVSYSVYLVHLPIIYVLQTHVPFGHSHLDWIQRLVLYVSVSLLVGTMFYWLVERWFLAGRCPQWRRSAQSAPGMIS